MDSARPSLDTLARVMSFIRQCVEANDAEKLYGACSRETDDFWKASILQDLRDLQQSETMERVFLKDGQVAVFPAGASAFKLGGHDVRTRHLHLDLEQIEGRWFWPRFGSAGDRCLAQNGLPCRGRACGGPVARPGRLGAITPS